MAGPVVVPAALCSMLSFSHKLSLPLKLTSLCFFQQPTTNLPMIVHNTMANLLPNPENTGGKQNWEQPVGGSSSHNKVSWRTLQQQDPPCPQC